MRLAFNAFDSNGDGFLNKEEFKVLNQKSNLEDKMTDQEINLFVSIVNMHSKYSSYHIDCCL